MSSAPATIHQAARAAREQLSANKLRALALARRKGASPAELAARSEALSDALLESLPRCPARSFAFFLPMHDEPDVVELAREWARQGAIACLPAPSAPGEPLSFWPWDFESGLERESHAIFWPRPALDPAIMPELILAPCSLFDAHGRRLGYGEGLYGATIEAARKIHPHLIALGCAYEWSRAPVGALDGAPELAGVATEEGYFPTQDPPIVDAGPKASFGRGPTPGF